MLVFVKHAAESVVSSYVKAGDLVRNHERHGQWLERPDVLRCPDAAGARCCDTRSHVVSELVEEVWLMLET